MSEQVLSLLRSVPKDHPLSQVVDSVLLPELQAPFEMTVSNNPFAFKHFINIYRRRYQYHLKRRIENYGFLESIAYMKAHPGPKRAASIDTQKFYVTVWMDPELKHLIGIIIVNRLQMAEMRSPYWNQLQQYLKENSGNQ